MKVTFSFDGSKFQADVPDDFKQLPVEIQQKRLYQSLESKYGLKEKLPKEDKNVLDYLTLLERPFQALKVGLKESNIGNAVYSAIGGVDLTPREGFTTGAKRGWMGQDEIRTQDFLPEDMNPIMKGVLGFAGDVVTDPLTWFGPQAVAKVGQGIKKASDVTGATPVLSNAAEQILNTNIRENYQVKDLLRNLNIATGKGKIVKGAATQAGEHDFARIMDEAMGKGLDDLQSLFVSRAEQLGIGVDNVHQAFVKAMERPLKTKNRLDRDGKKIQMRDSEGNPLFKNNGDPIYEQVKDRAAFGRVQFEEPIDEATRNILGDNADDIVDYWTNVFDLSSKYSQAVGQPIRDIVTRGYFPRIMTKEWKDTAAEINKVKADTVAEDIEPIFGTNYRQERVDIARDKGLYEASKLFQDEYSKMYAQYVGGSPNPIDVPFFEANPIIAIGTRLDQQAKALQKKWFINEITDMGPLGPAYTGAQLENYRAEYFKLTGKRAMQDTKDTPEFIRWLDSVAPKKQPLNIGTWVRTRVDAKGNPIYEKRIINPYWGGAKDFRNDKFLFQEMDKDEWAAFTQKEKNVIVDSIPDGTFEREIFEDAFKTNLANGMRISNTQFDPKIFNDLVGLERKSMGDIEQYLKTVHPTMLGQTRETLLSISKKAIDESTQSTNAGRVKFYAPADLQRQIKDTMNVMSGARQPNEFIKMYDKMQNAWKSWSLGVRPAYHTRNAIGNAWNAYMVAGVSPLDMLRLAEQSAKLQYYSRFGGSEAQRVQTLERMKGLNKTFFDAVDKTPYKKIKDSEWNAPNFAGTGYSMREIYEQARARGITAGHYTRDTVKELETSLRVRSGEGGRLERILGQDNPIVRGGFAIGGTIEGNFRFQVFLNTLQKIKQNPSKYEWLAPDGQKYKLNQKIPKDYFKSETDLYADRGVAVNRLMTKDDIAFDVASQEVKKSMFDYGDLSSFEQNWAKRVLPFYTWTRKNLPVQFKSLIQNPQRAEQLAIAKQQFEHNLGELDKSDYGQFWNDRVPVFLGNESEGVVKAFALMNLIPMADLQYMIDPKRVIGEMATPFIKAPLEALANYDTFMNRAIKSTPGQMDDFLGVKLPPRLHHLAKILVPLTEINRVNPAGIFGENILDPRTGNTIVKKDAYFGLGASRDTYKDVNESARWIRFFSGIATYDVNLDRNKYFDNKNLLRDVAELKGRLKWAVRKGENRKAEEMNDLLEAVMAGETTDPFERR